MFSIFKVVLIINMMLLQVLFKSPSAVVCNELRVWGLSAVMLHQTLEHIAPEYSPALKMAFY